MEEILAVDYGRSEQVVLYCNWVMTNMVGNIATMKRDDYGFGLVNFDRLTDYQHNHLHFDFMSSKFSLRTI